MFVLYLYDCWFGPSIQNLIIFLFCSSSHFDYFVLFKWEMEKRLNFHKILECKLNSLRFRPFYYSILSNVQHSDRTELNSNTNKNNNYYTKLSLLAKMCFVLCKLLFILLCCSCCSCCYWCFCLCNAFPKIQIPKGHKTYNSIQLFYYVYIERAVRPTKPTRLIRFYPKTTTQPTDQNQWVLSCLLDLFTLRMFIRKAFCVQLA